MSATYLCSRLVDGDGVGFSRDMPRPDTTARDTAAMHIARCRGHKTASRCTLPAHGPLPTPPPQQRLQAIGYRAVRRSPRRSHVGGEL